MKKSTRIALILIAVISFGIALSYPILYNWAAKKNNDTMEDLSRMRNEALREEKRKDDTSSGTDQSGDDNWGDLADSEADRPDDTKDQKSGERAESDENEAFFDETEEDELTDSEAEDESEPEELTDEDESSEEQETSGDDKEESESSAESSKDTDKDDSSSKKKEKSDKSSSEKEKTSKKEEASEEETSEKEEISEEEEEEVYEPVIEDFLLDYVPGMKWRQVEIPEYEEHDAPMLLNRVKKAKNRDKRSDALPYTLKEKVKLDEKKILPELKDIYKMNKDLVAWLSIDDTTIDYPVVQRPKDNEFYLHHDFFRKDNENGQIILDAKCDPYTPSYNLVVSGHHMRNRSMFGCMDDFKQQSYYENHKFVTFDTLMRRGTYVIFAAFYSADYDEYEDGFRYNADLRYKIDVDMWLDEVEENNIYDTDIPVAFGDEFLTLTTCDHSRRDDGRFVLICRRVREGEVFK